jgi:acetamidase/formamidase
LKTSDPSQAGQREAVARVFDSAAAELHIGQLVEAPNYAVTAILPLDIFE